MANIRWDKNSDWDSNQDNTGINHSNDPYTTSSTPETLKQGYQKQWPPLTHGLTGWWPLHTDKPIDLSGNANHGTKNGGVTTKIAGKAGLQAMNFDGTDDYITLGDLSEIEGAAEWSVSLWLKYDSGMEDGSNYGIFWLTDGDYTSRAGIRFGQDGNKLGFTGSNDGNNNDPVVGVKYSNLSPGVWYHLVGVYSGSNYYFYVNGTEKANASATNTTSPTFANPPKLGMTDDWGANLDGKLTDIRVYNRALKPSEIQTLYEWGSSDLASPPKDGVAYYKLDGDATDSWGTNDGTTNGGLVYSSDAIRGQSGDFDGADDYISVGNSIDVSSSGIYYSLWMKTTSGVSNNLSAISQGWGAFETNDYTRFIYDNSQGDVDFTVRGADTSDSVVRLSTPHPEGEWVQYTFGIDSSGNVRLYKNGGLVDIDTSTFSDTTEFSETGGDIWIGQEYSASSDWFFDGHIDDVRIYDYALTPQQIQELYRYGTRGINMNKHTVMQ